MSRLFALGGQHIGASLLAQVTMSLPALQEITVLIMHCSGGYRALITWLIIH